MKKIRFYEISADEAWEARISGQTPCVKDPIFTIIIDESDTDSLFISSETIKEKLLKDKNFSYFYLEVIDEEKNEYIYSIRFIEYKDSLTIYFTKKNEYNEYSDNPISGIEKFQADRLLDKQPFDFRTEVLNILEELVEMTGEESEAARKTAEEIFDNYFKDKPVADKEELVDCFTDIRVFSIGATMKLGYEPECALAEVAKEINSRTGKIVDGKFTKDKSPEAKAKWYKADFTKCGLRKQVKEI